MHGNALSPDLWPLVKIRRGHIEALRSGEISRPADVFKTHGIVYHKNEYGVPRGSSEEPGTLSEEASPQSGNDEAALTLQGVGCSGGIAQGEVVVAEFPDGADSVAGKILVVPRIHSDWVPYFPSLAGLLVEQGEILAHAMTVAREIGLPTVSGIPALRAQLKDGQNISLDGDQGWVRVLPKPEEGSASAGGSSTVR